MARVPRLKVGLSAGRGGRAGATYPTDPDFISDVRRQTQEMTDTLIDILDQFAGASDEIIINALMPTFKKARDEYCPIDTGALRESAYLQSTGTKKGPRVEIGFGKNKKPGYTMFVHEDPNMYHEPPTRYKFLQQAVLEDLDVIYQRLGAGYKVFMGMG